MNGQLNAHKLIFKYCMLVSNFSQCEVEDLVLGVEAIIWRTQH